MKNNEFPDSLMLLALTILYLIYLDGGEEKVKEYAKRGLAWLDANNGWEKFNQFLDFMNKLNPDKEHSI